MRVFKFGPLIARLTGRVLSIWIPRDSADSLVQLPQTFSQGLQKQFFYTYGAEAKIALETASPVLGSLNSGLQLYRLKHQKPWIFKQLKWSLHLPQYVSCLISLVVNWEVNSPGDSESPGEFTSKFTASEITSIGCHTMLWDFRKNDYHDWVKAEGITEKFPPIAKSGGDSKSPPDYPKITIGHGLHDSSAALILTSPVLKPPLY